MSPEKLAGLLTSLNCAAKVVEAIDDPVLQRYYGWDLSCWRYDLIPWGVRFIFQDPQGGKRVEIVILAAFRNQRVPRAKDQRARQKLTSRWNPYVGAGPQCRRSF
jgi:hypothetical protein